MNGICYDIVYTRGENNHLHLVSVSLQLRIMMENDLVGDFGFLNQILKLCHRYYARQLKETLY